MLNDQDLYDLCKTAKVTLNAYRDSGLLKKGSRTMKKYRVNESEHFNLFSMYEHLKVLEIEMEDGERPWDNSIFDRIDEVESLLDKAYCVGACVDWPTLNRIRQIQAERQMIRYYRCLAAGASERDAGMAFQL